MYPSSQVLFNKSVSGTISDLNLTMIKYIQKIYNVKSFEKMRQKKLTFALYCDIIDINIPKGEKDGN